MKRKAAADGSARQPLSDSHRSPRPSLARRAAVRAQTLGQLYTAVMRSPYWWLLPFCVVLTLFAFLFVVAQAIPGAAPFVYALF